MANLVSPYTPVLILPQDINAILKIKAICLPSSGGLTSGSIL